VYFIAFLEFVVQTCFCMLNQLLSIAQLVLFLLHVSTANDSLLDGATNAECMYSLLYKLSNKSGKILMYEYFTTYI